MPSIPSRIIAGSTDALPSGDVGKARDDVAFRAPLPDKGGGQAACSAGPHR